MDDMSDEQAEQVEDAEVVQPEGDAPAVDTVPETVPETDDPLAVLKARVAELEETAVALAAKVAERDAYIDQLEADPYRAVVSDQNGDVTEQLTYFEAQSEKAEMQARERAGVVFEEEPVVVPVDGTVEGATE